MAYPYDPANEIDPVVRAFIEKIAREAGWTSRGESIDVCLCSHLGRRGCELPGGVCTQVYQEFGPGKNNHQHQLEVASNGCPPYLSTASWG